jgi:hypothetical protein
MARTLQAAERRVPCWLILPSAAPCHQIKPHPGPHHPQCAQAASPLSNGAPTVEAAAEDEGIAVEGTLDEVHIQWGPLVGWAALGARGCRAKGRAHPLLYGHHLF